MRSVILIVSILSSVLSNGLSFQPVVAGQVTMTNLVPRGGKLTKPLTMSSSKTPRCKSPSTTALTSATASSGPSGGEEQWTKNRIHNTNWFRSGAVLLTLFAAGASQNSPIAQLSNQAGAALHLFAFSTWFGTMIYTTFIFGITAFKNLERQTFGKLQAKLFPKYFALGSICLVLQVLTLRSLPLAVTTGVKWSLGASLAATLFNQFYMEPYTTKMMLERYDLENSPGGKDTDRYKELMASFGKLHGMSSLSNLISLCGTVAYGFILASVLKS